MYLTIYLEICKLLFIIIFMIRIEQGETILKKIRGAAGADYFLLFTSACPPIGIFDAKDNIIKVTIISDRRSPSAGTRLIEECERKIRQLISFYKDQIYSGNRMIAFCRRGISGSTQ